VRIFLLGAPCAGKTTIAGPLRAAGVTTIDTDDEIVRLNGGSWPDIEAKNERFLPMVIEAAARLAEVVLLNSYMPVERTRQLRDQDFVVALLEVPEDELRRRDQIRLEAEGWTNREWFDWHQSVIREHRESNLIDHIIDGARASDEVTVDVLTLLRGD
jgi:hypothetical protein